MNTLLRTFLFSMFSLWFTNQIFPALQILGGLSTLLTATLVMTVLMIIVKPMLSILFVPLNLITFGMAKVFIPAIILYLLTILVPNIQIREWTFPGFTFSGFVIPSAHLNSALALFIAAVIMLITHNLLEKITTS